jgi:hypothetical protein
MSWQWITVAVGIWLMAAPAVVGYGGVASRQARLIGPLVAAIAWIATSEATRAVRWLNLPIGFALVLLAVGPGYSRAASVVAAVSGTIVVLVLLMRSPVKSRMGGGWRAIWRGESRTNLPAGDGRAGSG